MSSRGSYAKNGHITTSEYKPKPGSSEVYDATILVGQTTAHSLPDYSHSPFRILSKKKRTVRLRKCAFTAKTVRQSWKSHFILKNDLLEIGV